MLNAFLLNYAEIHADIRVLLVGYILSLLIESVLIKFTIGTCICMEVEGVISMVAKINQSTFLLRLTVFCNFLMGLSVEKHGAS